MAMERDPELQPVADRLRAAREAAGLSQVALAERTGISLAHVNRLETRGASRGSRPLCA